MSEERPNPIDAQLQAYAKQRRAQAGPPGEMHPATRQLLQGEVARVYRAQRQPAGARWGWWPRLAWATGMFAVLGFVAYMLVNTQPPATTVDEARAPVSAPAQAFPPQVAVQLQMQPQSQAKFQGAAPQQQQSQIAADRDQMKATPKLKAAVPAAPSLPPVVAAAPKREVANKAIAPAAPAPATPMAAPAPAPAAEMAAAPPPAPAAKGKVVSRGVSPAPASGGQVAAAATPQPQVRTLAEWYFRTAQFNEAEKFDNLSAARASADKSGYGTGGVPAAGGAAVASAPVPQPTQRQRFVLQTNPPVYLELETAGDRVRIIDADGSVYEGMLRQVAAAGSGTGGPAAMRPQASRTLTKQPRAEAKTSASAKPSAPDNAVTFVVTGVNRQQNQPVTITGRLSGTFQGGPQFQRVEGTLQFGRGPAHEFSAEAR